LLMRRESRTGEVASRIRAWDWKMPATVFTLIAAGYVAYSSVGILVFGFLGGYAKEEGLQTGTRYFLLELAQTIPGMHNLPIAAFYVFCVFVFGTLTLWALNIASERGSGAAFLRPAFAFGFVLMLLFSPHYGWYIIWLVPFLALLPNLTVLTYLTGFFYLYTTELADPGPKMFLANKYLYAAVLVAAIIDMGLRKWPLHRHYLVQPVPASDLQ
jgi:alpha-1,6-mannosyltransferase